MSTAWRTWGSCALGLCILLLGTAPLVAQRAKSTPLRSAKGRLDATLTALRKKAMRRFGAKIGVQVQLVDESKPRYSALANSAFIPASNMKLFTAALLLARLGPDYQFTTEFYLHKEDEGFLLSIVSGADPCLGEKRDPILGLIDKLRGAKALNLAAGVYLDDRAWPGPARPAQWPRKQLHFAYAAPTGAFAIEEGCILVQLDPGKRRTGACPVELGPGPLELPTRGEIQISTNKKHRTKIGAVHDAKGLRLFGRIKAGSPSHRLSVSVHETKDVYARYLWCRFKKAGIKIARFRKTGPKSKGQLIHRRKSPLSLALERILRYSNNFVSEQCLRIAAFEAGGEGSLLAGRKLLHKQFSPGTARAKEWIVADASGLSRGNRISAAVTCDTLCAQWAASYRKHFVAALPVNGELGSLKKRMKEKELIGRVHAKTGWIRGASSLSGFVTCKSGKTAAFSILVNYDPKRDGINKHFKSMQDQMVRAMFANL